MLINKGILFSKAVLFHSLLIPFHCLLINCVAAQDTSDALIDFTLEEEEKAVMLRWSVLNDANIKGFSLERAGDLSGWHELTYVKNEIQEKEKNLLFNFKDLDPLFGNSYYRLRQIDQDGNSSYSDLISIFRRHELEIGLLSSNPQDVNQDAFYQVYAPGQVAAALYVYDHKGQMIFKDQLSLEMGSTIASIPSTTLNEGIYYLMLEADNKSYRQKMIVNTP